MNFQLRSLCHAHISASVYFLYPLQVCRTPRQVKRHQKSLIWCLQNIALVASVYTTVVIAFERYVALKNPFTMRTASEDKKWLQVAKWVGPTIIFSIVFNIPMFFEHCFLEAEGITPLQDGTGQGI